MWTLPVTAGGTVLDHFFAGCVAAGGESGGFCWRAAPLSANADVANKADAIRNRLNVVWVRMGSGSGRQGDARKGKEGEGQASDSCESPMSTLFQSRAGSGPAHSPPSDLPIMISGTISATSIAAPISIARTAVETFTAVAARARSTRSLPSSSPAIATASSTNVIG